VTLGGVSLGNPVALWGLAGLAALVAVHFLQQRARRVALSTRFLIEALEPESRGGRTWERFRASRAFWLQVLALLALLWVLADPRWPRADSAQTVVLVLDDALAMQAVVEPARAAARRLMTEAEGQAVRTEWVILGSDPRAPRRYRGTERARAEAALAAWRPSLGTHDYAPALAAGRALAAEGGGVCWFLTDREAKVPPEQAALGVGRPLANAGFAGGEVRREGAGWTWRAVVKNSAGEAQRRVWWIEGPAGASARREVELLPDAVVELSGAWPAEAERATLRLASDGFEADDALPLVRPESKRLRARVALAGEPGEFFRKLLGGIDGVDLSAALSAALGAELRVGEEAAGEAAGAGAAGAAIVLAAAGGEAKETRALLRAPVVAERHALVDGLNWQGLLGPGPAGLASAPDDEVLLWQAERPLVWLRAGGPGRRALVLNLEWAEGNAGRLPATVLLVRRFVESTRDARPGPYRANFDANAAVPLAEADLAGEAVDWTIEREGEPRRLLPPEERTVLRAPAEAGFFSVRRGDEVLVTGAARFADARQGDFRGAGEFRREPPAAEAEARRRRNTQTDPLAALWLALAGVALLASWWPGRAGRTEAWSQKARKPRTGRKHEVRA
jgi:hypothetical protein